MSFEEEFDKIIRRKAEEEKYPFDESNWQKTSLLIDAEKKASRMLTLKKFYLPAILVLGVGISCFVTYSYVNTEKASAVKSDLPAQNLIAENGDKIQSSGESLTPDKDNSLSQNNAVSKFTEQNVSPAKSASADNISGTTGKKMNTTSVAEIDLTMAGTKEHTAQTPFPETTVTPNGPANEEKKENTGNLNGSDVNPVFTDNSIDQKTVEESGSPVFNANENAEIINSQKLFADQLASVYLNLPYEETDLQVLPTPFTALSRYDDDYYKNRPKKTHYMNLEAGANYLLGWDTKAGTDAKGMNWFAGINYGFYLTRKVSVGFGIQGYNISNIKQPFYINTKKEYDFGSTDTYTLITGNDLYYLSVPLKFNYNINASNSFGLGINMGYLIAAKNSVDMYSIQQENGKSETTTSHNNGIYQGMRTSNIMLSAHYTAKLNKRFGISTEFNYGLTDIFENKGSINTFEKPMGLKLSIQYTLFDK